MERKKNFFNAMLVLILVSHILLYVCGNRVTPLNKRQKDVRGVYRKTPERCGWLLGVQ